MNRRNMLVGLGLGGLALLPFACGRSKSTEPKGEEPPPPEPGKEAPESESGNEPPTAPGAETKQPAASGTGTQ